MKFIRQHDSSDCGIACLSMLVTHYGCRLPLSRLREMASTNVDFSNGH